MRTRVTRIVTAGPDDVTGLRAAFSAGHIRPDRIVAVLGKTEGNGCVNDFTRAFASQTLKQALAEALAIAPAAVAERVALVMSGGTEGGLAPHWLVFEVDPSPAPVTAEAGRAKTLAAGVGFSREFAPEELGRTAQIHATRDAVVEAMRRARIDDPADVHYVQIKCPLLTAPRMAAASGRGVVTRDTYESMGYSRGASALGVALALGEVAEQQLSDDVVCRDFSLYSSRAGTSAGIELMRNEVMVLGNSAAWDSGCVIGHAVMADAIDVAAADRALAPAGQRGEVIAVLAKAEPARSGLIRGRRHVMLDDSDIHASRHARAFVGGALAGRFGDTALFISGGAEHQGPDGGGPLAVIVKRR